MADLLWLVPALPLAGVIVNGLFGPRLGKRVVAVIGPGVVGAAFVAAFAAFLELRGMPVAGRMLSQTLFEWIPAGDFSASIGLLVDPLSSTVMLVVTGVGFLIHLYSVGYMSGDAGFARYFTYLNLFTFAMLLLVKPVRMLMSGVN